MWNTFSKLTVPVLANFRVLTAVFATTMRPLRQALIYFAVSKKGEAPIDGVTDANPEGLTSTCGKWAGEFKQRLADGSLTCHELPEDR